MKVITALIVSFLLALAVGCAVTESKFQPSLVTPGVVTDAGASADPNDNGRVKFKVTHLALPGSAVASKAFYLVWAKNLQNCSVSLDRLWIGAGRDGSVEATRLFIEFRLIVTAKTGKPSTNPSKFYVLSTELLGPEPHGRQQSGHQQSKGVSA